MAGGPGRSNYPPEFIPTSPNAPSFEDPFEGRRVLEAMPGLPGFVDPSGNRIGGAGGLAGGGRGPSGPGSGSSGAGARPSGSAGGRPSGSNSGRGQGARGAGGDADKQKDDPECDAECQKKWRKKKVNGRDVYQRDDLIDPNKTGPDGRTNRERMSDGDAPIGPDNKPVNLHHMTQDEPGSIAEVDQSFHKDNHGILHMYPNGQAKIGYDSSPPSIDRGAFGNWSRGYWQTRSKDF